MSTTNNNHAQGGSNSQNQRDDLGNNHGGGSSGGGSPDANSSQQPPSNGFKTSGTLQDSLRARRTDLESDTSLLEDPDQMPPSPLVVIGGSAGAFQELLTMLAGIPSDYRGVICVTLHTSPQSQMLAANLARSATLPVQFAFNGVQLKPGRIYVAPPDYHTLVKRDHLVVVRGPRENHCRPAIDPMFRSAAVAHGRNVRAIILSGYLDDGASGSIAVARCGGRVAVQAPSSTSAPDMPTNTLAVVDVDFVGNPLQLTRWLVGTFEEDSVAGHSVAQMAGDELSGNGLTTIDRQAPSAASVSTKLSNRQIEREVHISESIESNISLEENLGELVPMTCPECSGPLWEMRVDKVRRYRCHTGHAYTAKALIAHQDETIEKALWAAMRLMQERANSLEQLSKDNLVGGEVFAERADESRANADVLRGLLVGSCKPDNAGQAQLAQTEQKHV